MFVEEGIYMRDTYALLNLKNLENNLKEIRNKYHYQYYIGVVKNDCYHHGPLILKTLVKNGINYLAVSSLDEALKVRKVIKNIPILCLEPINLKYLKEILNNNITITIDNLEYLKLLVKEKIRKKLKIHLAIDTGMNRLGFTKRNEINEAVKIINTHSSLVLEGIFSHFKTSGLQDSWYYKQLDRFKYLTKDIDLKNIPVIHLGRSITMQRQPKVSFSTGIRIGLLMYGYRDFIKYPNTFILKLKENYYKKKYPLAIYENHLNVQPIISLYTSIISKREVNKGFLVGYGLNNKIKNSGFIYTLPIGYADGVSKKFGYVYILKEKCEIIADSMDMLMVYSSNDYDIGTKVEIFGNLRSAKSLANYLGINIYHLLNLISSRVTKRVDYDE